MNIFKIFDFFFWFCHPCRTPCEKERRSFSAVSGAKNIFKTKAKVRKIIHGGFPARVLALIFPLTVSL